jgi:hypothetical protein
MLLIQISDLAVRGVCRNGTIGIGPQQRFGVGIARMKEAVSQSLFAYWNSLRGGRLAPKRFEIEPSCIAPFLPDAFILERVDHGLLRFRLAGTRISEAFGFEFRGINLFELFEKDDLATLQRQIALVASQGAVGVFEILASDAAGMSATFELLILPLTHTREAVDRLLGSIAPIEKPNWLGTVPLTRRKLLRHDIIWPDGRPRAVIQSMQRQAPFSPVVREARIVRSKRRQFRVYDGGLSRNDDR